MQNRFKVLITNKTVYKEIELIQGMEAITVGTSFESDVRLRKDIFFENVEIRFNNVNGEWKATCSENLYFSSGDSRKIFSLSFKHGDKYRVHYQNSGNELLIIEFQIDFDYDTKNYDREIYTSGKKEIKICANSQADIQILDRDFSEEFIILKNENGQLILYDMGCKYGVFVNGKRIQKFCALKDLDFFSLSGYSFFYKQDKLYTSSNESIKTRGLAERIINRENTVLKYPKFNRNTRIQYEIPIKTIEIQRPSAKLQLKKKSILFTLIPMIVMLVMMVALRGFMGGGGMFVIYSAVSISMGMIMSVITYFQDKKEFEQGIRQREVKYQEYLADKESQIKILREKEKEILNIVYESLENNLEEVKKHGKRLFERGNTDKDFLHVYLGVGRLESLNPISINHQEMIDMEDPLVLLPEKLAKKYEYLQDVPVYSNFKSSNAVGIVGDKTALKEMLKNMTMDIGIRHFYKEVRMFYIFNDEFAYDFAWVQWLKNVDNDKLKIKNIVCDEESRNMLLEDLYVILSNRQSMETLEQGKHLPEHYVVFVTKSADINLHPLSKFIKDAHTRGFTFVFFEEHEELLPRDCDEIIRLEKEKGTLISSKNGDMKVEFVYPTFTMETMKEIALRLGAIYVDEVSLEEQLTQKITLFEMMGILSVDDIDLASRWSNSCVYKSLAAPIGIKGNKEIVYLDISDKQSGHGPHGLVAGTTGSGKSEILQTYILSLATLFHPHEVGFVLIDFKGGGMANQFSKLPHLMGAITNIDGREINRSLLSIKAELIKRQELFSEANVNHINDYIRLYKEGKVRRAIPHLIIIVDEFAELKVEFPDFMKELISAARIGRTLGVHLILATQKPAGVVDSQIWSNSRFKLCLRVQTIEDSKEVIKTPLAAEILEPGRAYFQVGNNEIFELFQSAYSGDIVPVGGEEKLFSIYERNLWGKRKTVFSNKEKKEGRNNITQLNSIIDHVSHFCKANHVNSLPGICLPSLEYLITAENLDYTLTEKSIYNIPIGVYDDPMMQKQGQVDVNLSKNNIYIVGSPQSGKTTLLQTMLYGVIRKYSPKQINVYIIDCGSMVMKTFEESNHVGGVVLPNEDEKCKNLFKLLNSKIAERKKRISDLGISNFVGYLEAGYDDMPLLVVFIDNFSAFKEYFAVQAEQLNVFVREGLGVGLSFVITANASNALNYRVQADFGEKIVLNCNDASEYSGLLGNSRMKPREGEGSGLFSHEKRILEWQAAIYGGKLKEIERTLKIKDYIQSRNTEFKDTAIQIPQVPDRLLLEKEMTCYSSMFKKQGIIPIGMNYITIEYSNIDLYRSGSLLLLGDNEKKLGFTQVFLKTISKYSILHNIEAIVIDDKRKGLQEVKEYGFVKRYTSDLSEALIYLGEFLDIRKSRKLSTEPDNSLQIVVINNAELLNYCYNDRNLSSDLAEALKKANDINMFVLLMQVENVSVGFSSSEILKAVKEEKQGLLFAPLSENRFYDIGLRIKPDPVFDNTMAYRFENDSYYKIKLFEQEEKK